MAYVRTKKPASGGDGGSDRVVLRGAGRGTSSTSDRHTTRLSLKAAARQRLAAGQMELGLGPDWPGASGPLEIASSRMGHLWVALCRDYDALGFPAATGHDEVFRQLVLARIMGGPASRTRPRILEEGGPGAVVSHAEPVPAGLGAGAVAARPVQGVRSARQAGVGVAGALRRFHPLFRGGAGRRVPRARPLQGTPPRATDHRRPAHRAGRVAAHGLRLRGNRAVLVTKTMLSVIEKFMAAAHQLPDVTVVADTGMISEANQNAIKAAGLSFILGMKIPDVPY